MGLSLNDIKLFRRLILKSDTRWSDFGAIVKSLLWAPKNVLIANSVKFRNEGNMSCKSYLNFGVASNRKALDYNAMGALRIAKGAFFESGEQVRIARAGKIFVKGKLTIGSHTYIQANCNIIVNQEVYIGSNCAISWNCTILDDDLHTISIEGQEKKRSLPVHIGDHVWIGCDVKILKGVTIGSGAVIAAGSVVTGDIPAGCLAGGIPAKVIKNDVTWK